MSEDYPEHEFDGVPINEKDQINSVLSELYSAYCSVLYMLTLKSRLLGSYNALQEYNAIQKGKNLPPSKITSEKLSSQSLEAAKDYEKTLRISGSSPVVEKLANTEKLISKDWFKELQQNTKDQILDIFQRSIKESWSAEQLHSELDKVEELFTKKRVKSAAFNESRVQKYLGQMQIYQETGVEEIQRHVDETSNVCPICMGLDKKVFRLGSQPDLSHYGCNCYYSIYINPNYIWNRVF